MLQKMTIISYIAQLLEFFQTKFLESGSVYLAGHKSSYSFAILEKSERQ